MSAFETISMEQLARVSGGADEGKKKKEEPKKDDYETEGNPVQQGGQMVDNAVEGYKGARKAGCNWYESLGNATIAFFRLRGGFDKNGKPRD